MLPSSSLAEEHVKGVVAPANGLVGRHLPVRLDTVLQAVQLPAGIADLDTGLSNMDRDALTLQRKKTEMQLVRRIAIYLNEDCS